MDFHFKTVQVMQVGLVNERLAILNFDKQGVGRKKNTILQATLFSLSLQSTNSFEEKCK